MARVVVVGGGFGGLATAARLAKLGHDVTLARGGPTGSAAPSGYVEQDGFRWDAGPTSHAAAGRDPRPVPQVRAAAGEGGRPGARSSRCASTASRTTASSTSPGGSRAAQLARSTTALGAGLGRQWAAYVDDVRRGLGGAAPDYLERPCSAEHASKARQRACSTPG